jgi:hypothetical protein
MRAAYQQIKRIRMSCVWLPEDCDAREPDFYVTSFLVMFMRLVQDLDTSVKSI